MTKNIVRIGQMWDGTARTVDPVVLKVKTGRDINMRYRPDESANAILFYDRMNDGLKIGHEFVAIELLNLKEDFIFQFNDGASIDFVSPQIHSVPKALIEKFEIGDMEHVSLPMQAWIGDARVNFALDCTLVFEE